MEDAMVVRQRVYSYLRRRRRMITISALPVPRILSLHPLVYLRIHPISIQSFRFTWIPRVVLQSQHRAHKPTTCPPDIKTRSPYFTAHIRNVRRISRRPLTGNGTRLRSTGYKNGTCASNAISLLQILMAPSRVFSV